MAAKRPLFSFVTVLLFLLAIPPAKLNTNEITECNCIKRDDTPTRQQLTLMVVPDLKISLRIKDRISDYDTLGTFLLNDETGGILEEIRHDYRFSKQRKDEIFDRWIKGEGQVGIMKSNTWGMLVKSLRDSELNALADKIESILQFCTDKSLHLDNSKCVIVNAEHTSPGQVLSVSVVTVIVVIGSAVIIIYYQKPFQAHDCEYAAYLKHRYKPKKQQRTVDSGVTWPPVDITEVFQLAMIKCKRVKRMKEARKMQNDDLDSNTQVEVKDIFTGIEGNDRRIVLIEGVAGSGKSTLSLYLCQQWQEGNMFQEYRYVILVKLRETPVQEATKIADILPQDLEDRTMGLKAASTMNEDSGKGVLFIFDGFDELPQCAGHNLLMELLKGDRFPESSVILTSRPISTLTLQHYVNARFEILGFEKSELHKFFVHYLNNVVDKDDNKNVDTLLQKIQENPVLESFLCLPLNATIYVYLFEHSSGSDVPTTEYKIFCELVLNRIVRHQKKKQNDCPELKSLDSLPDIIKKDFDNLCKVAFDGAKDGTIIFDQLDDCNTLGLIQSVESFARHGESVSYNFIHLAIQELLSALYLATQVEATEQKNKFNELFGRPRFTGVFRYYAAHTKLKTPGIENIVTRALTQHARATKLISGGSDTASQDFTFDYAPQPLLLSVIHCLFNAEDDHLYQSIAQQLDKKLDLHSITLKPADCMSIGAFLAYCEQFTVQMYSCRIDNDGCKMLFRKNRRYPFCILNLSVNSIGDEGAVAISEAMKTMTNLKELHLWGNSIGVEGAVAISEAMKTMTNLQTLDLSLNSIGVEGAVAISEAMKTMTNLKTLYLAGNSIGDEGAVAISEAMKTMTNLKDLNLYGNNAITEVGREAVEEAAKLSGTRIVWEWD